MLPCKVLSFSHLYLGTKVTELCHLTLSCVIFTTSSVSMNVFYVHCSYLSIYLNIKGHIGLRGSLYPSLWPSVGSKAITVKIKIYFASYILKLQNFPTSRWASDLAQRVKALATKPDDLSLILKIHVVEGQKWLPKVVLWPPMHDTAQVFLSLLPHPPHIHKRDVVFKTHVT